MSSALSRWKQRYMIDRKADEDRLRREQLKIQNESKQVKEALGVLGKIATATIGALETKAAESAFIDSAEKIGIDYNEESNAFVWADSSKEGSGTINITELSKGQVAAFVKHINENPTLAQNPKLSLRNIIMDTGNNVIKDTYQIKDPSRRLEIYKGWLKEDDLYHDFVSGQKLKQMYSGEYIDDDGVTVQEVNLDHDKALYEFHEKIWDLEDELGIKPLERFKGSEKRHWKSITGDKTAIKEFETRWQNATWEERLELVDTRQRIHEEMILSSSRDRVDTSEIGGDIWGKVLDEKGYVSKDDYERIASEAGVTMNSYKAFETGLWHGSEKLVFDKTLGSSGGYRLPKLTEGENWRVLTDEVFPQMIEDDPVSQAARAKLAETDFDLSTDEGLAAYDQYNLNILEDKYGPVVDSKAGMKVLEFEDWIDKEDVNITSIERFVTSGQMHASMEQRFQILQKAQIHNANVMDRITTGEGVQGELVNINAMRENLGMSEDVFLKMQYGDKLYGGPGEGIRGELPSKRHIRAEQLKHNRIMNQKPGKTRPPSDLNTEWDDREREDWDELLIEREWYGVEAPYPHEINPYSYDPKMHSTRYDKVTVDPSYSRSTDLEHGFPTDSDGKPLIMKTINLEDGSTVALPITYEDMRSGDIYQAGFNRYIEPGESTVVDQQSGSSLNNVSNDVPSKAIQKFERVINTYDNEKLQSLLTTETDPDKIESIHKAITLNVSNLEKIAIDRYSNDNINTVVRKPENTLQPLILTESEQETLNALKKLNSRFRINK